MHRNDYVLEKDRLNESRVFRDPIHRYIHIYHLPFWQLINTKEMQRLRRIHQLGGTHQVYQTAEHTRFPHSRLPSKYYESSGTFPSFSNRRFL